MCLKVTLHLLSAGFDGCQVDFRCFCCMSVCNCVFSVFAFVSTAVVATGLSAVIAAATASPLSHLVRSALLFCTFATIFKFVIGQCGACRLYCSALMQT